MNPDVWLQIRLLYFYSSAQGRNGGRTRGRKQSKPGPKILLIIFFGPDSDYYYFYHYRYYYDYDNDYYVSYNCASDHTRERYQYFGARFGQRFPSRTSSGTFTATPLNTTIVKIAASHGTPSTKSAKNEAS